MVQLENDLPGQGMLVAWNESWSGRFALEPGRVYKLGRRDEDDFRIDGDSTAESVYACCRLEDGGLRIILEPGSQPLVSQGLLKKDVLLGPSDRARLGRTTLMFQPAGTCAADIIGTGGGVPKEGLQQAASLVETHALHDPRLPLLKDLGDLLIGESAEAEVPHRLLRMLARGISADRWVIALKDPEGELSIVADTEHLDPPGDGEAPPNNSLGLPEELLPRILEQKETIMLSPAAKTDVTALMGVPVAHESACYGLVYAHRRQGPDFTASDLALVGVSARFLAALLSSLRLKRRLRQQNREMAKALGRRTLMIEGGAMERVRERVRRVAASDIPVLVFGETGSGKELVASALHKLSGRSGELVALNCAALPEQLLESELFGHVTGAFTGAQRDRTGKFRQATGGTLFLDEISEMAPGIQAKFLRVLEHRIVTPLGSDRSEPVDCRIVAASNKQLAQLVQEGSFRRDLFYRLNSFEIAVPPLRERQEEILPLAEFFLSRFATEEGPVTLSHQVRAALLQHSWPGNIRELRNVVERAFLLSDGEQIRLQDLEGLAAGRRLELSETNKNEALPSLEQLEQRHIRKVIRALEGNVAKAAEVLGISRPTLYKKLKRYGIER